MEQVNAIVLAGGRNSPTMEQATGVTNRALVRLGDRTMLDRVVAAVRGAAWVDRVFVVGDVPPSVTYTSVPGGETLMDNLLAGLEAAAPGHGRVLICSADIPFLTAEAVADFVSRARATGADLCYPIVPIAACRAQFPQMRRTTLKLREGTFTGGNIFLLNPAVILERRALIERAYAARKDIWQMGRLLGWGLLARIALAQIVAPVLLTLPPLERGVGRVLGGCRAAAVVTEFAEIGTDVDKPEDVTAAQEILTARGKSAAGAAALGGDDLRSP